MKTVRKESLLGDFQLNSFFTGRREQTSDYFESICIDDQYEFVHELHLILLSVWLLLICCGNIHLKSLRVLYSVLKSYFSFKESDWLWQRVSVPCNQFSLSLFLTYSLFRKKSCVVKRCWIKHKPPTVYRTWQVIPNYWKLANCWNTFQATELCSTEEQINEDAGSDCFFSRCYF